MLCSEKMKLLGASLVLNTLILYCKADVYSGTGVTGNLNLSGKPIILLGGLFPIHKNEDNSFCGGILDLGVQRLEAMVFATRLVNQSPDLLPHVTLAFEIRDTCVQPNLALEESLDYVSTRNSMKDNFNSTVNGISGVVGAASSSVSIAVANLLRLFQVPQISYASTAKILSDKSRFEYFFRTIPPDSLQAKAMADIIAKFNWTYIHAIYSEDAYGSEGIAAFFDEINGVNKSVVCLASDIGIPLGITSESMFDQVVQQLDQDWVGNSSVVVLFGQLSTATGILSAVKRRDLLDPGFAQKFTWIGSDAWGDQLPSELHSVAKGMLSISPKARLSKDFDLYFTSLNPINYTANPWFSEYWELVFNCSFKSDQNVKACNPANEFISTEAGYRQNGKVTFTMDAVFAFSHAIHDMITELCPSNQLCPEIIDNNSGGPAVRGEMLLNYLHNVSFSGTSTDIVAFDSSGDEKGDFIIKNLKKSLDIDLFYYNNVGIWSDRTLLHFHDDIEWNNGNDVPLSVCSLPCDSGKEPEPVEDLSECCWTCKSCPRHLVSTDGLACINCDVGEMPNSGNTQCVPIYPTYLKWSDTWAIIILIASFFGVIATGVVVAVFIIFHKHELIKASSRELSAVLLCGLLLCYILPLFFMAKPSVSICTIRRFGVGFVFSLCYSALLIKTNRIHRIFSRPQVLKRPKFISPLSQIVLTLVLVFVQVVIAIIWLVIERPHTETIYDGFSGELRCKESTHIGLFISLGYNLILLLLSTYYAFRSMKIPQNFNEARFINLTVYTLCIVWLAFIPTYFATAELGTVYQTTSLVLAITLSGTTTLCLLFMPKLYFLRTEVCGIHGDVAIESDSNYFQIKVRDSRNHSICSSHGDNMKISLPERNSFSEFTANRT